MRKTNPSRRIPRTVLIACVALTVAVTGAPALAAGPVSPAETAKPAWHISQLTPHASTAAATTRIDAHTTWVSGMHLSGGSGENGFRPAIWERDDRVGKGWRELPIDASPLHDTRFNDVDASGGGNALTVGDYSEKAGGIVTQRLSGGKWRTVIAPSSRDSVSSGLLSVESLSPRNGWAVGWDQIPSPDGSRHVGQIQHWDGRKWSRSALPDVGEGPEGGWQLTEVAAHNSRSVWAVGGTFSAAGAEPLVLRYDGAAWKKVTLPAIGERAQLNAVTAAPDGTVWAVGEVGPRFGPSAGLALRYDGKKWTRAALPQGTGALQSVTFSRGVPVVLAQAEDWTPSVLQRAGKGWKQLDLPTTVGGSRLAGLNISGHGRTLDVGGALIGPNGEAGPAVVLTARR
ncbi:hypothetical protein ABT354_13845 [Streptomyces sp. NPDC000594]|uniref:hypothetical protein n=1 Tax=Streptomyces sp. NPDC000594 TaxID=3154261 RepID=UPI00333141F9